MPCAIPEVTTTCAGVARDAAHAAEVVGERAAQLGRAARVAVVQARVGRVAQRAAQRRQPARAREQGDVGRARAGSRTAAAALGRGVAGAPRPAAARRGDARRRSLPRRGGSPRRRAGRRPRRRRRAIPRDRARARAWTGARCRARAGRCAPRTRSCSSSCARSGARRAQRQRSSSEGSPRIRGRPGSLRHEGSDFAVPQHRLTLTVVQLKRYDWYWHRQWRAYALGDVTDRSADRCSRRRPSFSSARSSRRRTPSRATAGRGPVPALPARRGSRSLAIARGRLPG